MIPLSRQVLLNIKLQWLHCMRHWPFTEPHNFVASLADSKEYGSSNGKLHRQTILPEGYFAKAATTAPVVRLCSEHLVSYG
jgi:hypothetical protein